MADFSAICPPDTPLNAPINGLETIEEQQQKIDKAVTLLVQRQFHAEIFTIHNINNAGFTTNQFLKHMHILTCIKEVDELVEVLELGDGKFWMTTDTCELDGLLKFVNWFKTSDGRTALNNLSKQRRLQKTRARFTMTPAEAALVEIAKIQLADYANAQKEVCIKYEEKLNELHRKIRLLDQEYQREMAEFKQKFLPMSEYIPPDIEIVQKEAYEMYNAYEAAKHQ